MQFRYKFSAAPSEQARGARRRWRVAAYVAAIVAGCLLAFMAVAAFHSMLVDRQERISQAEDKLHDLQRDQERLRIRIFRAESPVNVLQQAERLGLTEAHDVQNLSVPEGIEAPKSASSGTTAELSDGEAASVGGR